MKAWKRLISRIGDPAVIRDHEGRVLHCNAAFAALFGAHEPAIEGRPLGKILGRDLAALGAAMDRCERDPEIGLPVSLRTAPNTGAERRFEASLVRLSLPPRSATLALLSPRPGGTRGSGEQVGAGESTDDRLESRFRGLLARLLDARPSREEAIEGLREIRSALGAGEALLFSIEDRGKPPRILLSDTADGGRAERFDAMASGGLPSPWLDRLADGLRVPLPPSSSKGAVDSQRRFLATHGVQSLLLEPLVRGDDVTGALAVVDPEQEDAWGTSAGRWLPLLARVLEGLRARALADSRRGRLDELMTHCPLAVVHADAQARILAVNPAYERLAGCSTGEVVGRPFTLLEEALRGERRVSALASALAQGRPWSGRLPRKRPDGTPFELMVQVVPLGGRPGAPDSHLCFLRDLSETLELDEASRAAQKHVAIGRLAAGIAHEINTPAQYVMDNVRFLAETQGALHDALGQLLNLQRMSRSGTVAQGSLEAVERSLDDMDLTYLLSEAPNAVAQALEGVEKIAEIVGALRRFAAPAPGRRDMVDVNRAIETTLEVARHEWALVAEVETALAPELPEISLVASEFNQVLLSLIENAAEAIDRGRRRGENRSGRGLIRVSSALREGHVEIRVEDDGIGLTPEVRERAFEPFFSTKEVGQGMGQGLAVAHSVIVDRHAGTLSLAARSGGGSVVTVRLPLTPAVSPAPVLSGSPAK